MKKLVFMTMLALASCSRKPSSSATAHSHEKREPHAQPDATSSSPTTTEAPTSSGNVVTIGVNVANPQFGSTSEQDATIAQLKAAGVTTMRVPLANDDSVAFITRAFNAGILADAIVRFPARDGATPRPIDKAVKLDWAEYGLSESDPEKLRVELSKQLATLEASGVQLRALEVGNEINWTPFNGDFPAPGSGRILATSDLSNPNDAEAKKIVEGYLVYLKDLAVVKEVRDHSQLNQKTPVLLGGLATIGMPGPRPNGKIDAVGVSASIDFFRKHGVDKLVDGIGVHIYPSGSEKLSVAARIESFEKDPLEKCTAAKPCWITEWGMMNNGTTCPINDDERAEVVGSVRSAFKSFADSGRVAGLIYFSWSGQPHEKDPDRRALFRCGVEMKSGPVALAPM